MGADDKIDAVDHAVAKFTPGARGALRRTLLRALGRAAASESPACLVNTTLEQLDLELVSEPLAGVVARAARDGRRAPIVRLDHESDYALLVSPDHIWLLVDHVDELALALEVLAAAWARGRPDVSTLRRLLERLEGLT